jgi:hypothetical protein
LSNAELGPYAAQALARTARFHPQLIFQTHFADDSQFPKYAQFMREDARITNSFVSIASVFLSNRFPVNGSRELSFDFPKFAVCQCFAEAVFNRYIVQTKRWRALSAVLQLGYDACICSREIVEWFSRDQSFGHSLISMVQNTADVLASPPPIVRESATVRHDARRDDVILQFDCTALSFISFLVALDNKPQTSLSKTFFQQSMHGPSFFTTLLSFMSLTHPLAASLRRISLELVSQLCKVAASLDVEVTLFYPRAQQAILFETVRNTLFKSDDSRSLQLGLRFISDVLASQPVLGAAFIRLIGGPFLQGAVSRLSDIRTADPATLLYIARLLARVFQHFTPRSSIITDIAARNLWPGIRTIIDTPAGRNAALIGAKASLLQCWLIAGQPTDSTLLRRILNDVLDALSDPLKPREVRSFFDLSKLTLPIPRDYGPSFFIDDELVIRFLGTIQNDPIIKAVRSVNEELSRFDAATQLLSVAIALIRNGRLEVPPEIPSQIATAVFQSVVCPDSFAELAFDLVDSALGPGSDAPPDFVEALAGFVGEGRATNKALSVIARLLAGVSIPPSPGLVQIINGCLGQGIDEAAIACATEVAAKLIGTGAWISDFTALVDIFWNGVKTGEKRYEPLLDFFAVVCASPENAGWLEKRGFFSGILTIEWNEESSLWPRLFRMLSFLPEGSNAALGFVSVRMPVIAVFMADGITIGHCRTQLSLSALLVTLASRVMEFMVEGPDLANRLVEIVEARLRGSFRFLKEKPSVPFEGIETDFTQCNEKMCHLVVLRNCIAFLNGIYEFPYGNGLVDLELMDRILNFLQNVAVKDGKEKVMPVIVDAFEGMLRLFCGRLASLGGGDGPGQVKDHRDQILKSIQGLAATKKISVRSRELLDGCTEILDKLF